MAKEIRKAVGAIIGWKDHPNHVILVLKVKTEDTAKADITPEWDIPKGGMKPGENKEQALWRELDEEVGKAKFSIVQELPFGMNFDLPSNDKWKSQETALFLLEYDGDGNNLMPNTSEIAEARLVPIDKVKGLVKYDTTINAIEKARKFGLK